MLNMACDPHLITYYETCYWVEGKYPTKEDVQRLFGYSPAQYIKEVAELIEPLKNRGLPTSSLEPPPPVKKKVPENLLDPLFVLAVGFIVDTVDKRTTAAKLKAAGVSTNQWKAFLEKADHRAYFEKRLDSSFNKDVENSAKLSLSRNVEAGDLQSIRYFHEYTGRYRPDAGLSMNIGILIGRLMEILSSRMTPEELLIIADEFELALTDNKTKELSA